LAKKVEATALRQRFSPGHADILRAIPGYLGQDVRDRPPLAAVEGVGRVAVLAAQRATREPHENGGNSYVLGLALERMKDLGDFQALAGAQCASGGSCCSFAPARRAASPPG